MIFNPNDKPLVTNREMDITKLDFNHLNYTRISNHSNAPFRHS